MTVASRLLPLFAAGALALGLAGCTAAGAPTVTPTATVGKAVTEGACSDEHGVTFIVDSSALAGGDVSTWCDPADEALAVSAIVSNLGLKIEGTKEYPDEVVCRVDGLPSASDPVGSTEDPDYVEACEKMPAAFAYWSLWVKPADGEWAYAQEGLSTLTAKPGESVELLFTLDGKPAAPAT